MAYGQFGHRRRAGRFGRPQRLGSIRNLDLYRNRPTRQLQPAGQGKPFAPFQSAPKPSGQAPTAKPSTPFSPAYESAKARIEQGYKNLLDQYKFGGTQLSQGYGFDEQGREITDPKNVLYNPFNRMKLLRDSFATANKGSTNAMAAQGQLYSGALQNQLNYNRQGFDVSEDDLKRDYTTGRRALLDAWLSGRDELGRELEGAEKDYLEYILANRPDPTAGSGGGGTGGAGGGAAPRPQVPHGTPANPIDLMNPKGQTGEIETTKRRLRPTADPPKGYRWVRRNGRWTLRRVR